jgi:hypothetical protein
MRISRVAVIAAILAVPSLGYAQYAPPNPLTPLFSEAAGAPVGAVTAGAPTPGWQLAPVPSVPYSGRIAVGATIPRNGSVPTYFIPNYSHRYAYTVLDGHEVIVNRRTARIVRVLS